jgi:hypothetical protein
VAVWDKCLKGKDNLVGAPTQPNQLQQPAPPAKQPTNRPADRARLQVGEAALNLPQLAAIAQVGAAQNTSWSTVPDAGTPRKVFDGWLSLITVRARPRRPRALRTF